VQSLFPLVVFGAVALSIVMSLVFLFTRGSTYDEIGHGGLVSGTEGGGGPPRPAPPPRLRGGPNGSSKFARC
jgi:hypothetical protein